LCKVLPSPNSNARCCLECASDHYANRLAEIL